MKLTTDAELAEEFGITVGKLHELRKKHNWPHVRLGRFDFRFTDQQVGQIVAAQSVVPTKGTSSTTAAPAGLTQRSAARRRTAAAS